MTNHNPFDTSNAPGMEEEFDFTTPVTGDAAMEDGEYIGKLISLTKETSKSGNPMVVWTFAVFDGVHAGRELRLWTVTTDKAVWKFNETLMALGLGKVENGQVVARFKRSEAIGTLCTLVVKNEEYQGRMSPKVDKVLPHPEGAGKKAPAAGVPNV